MGSLKFSISCEIRERGKRDSSSFEFCVVGFLGCNSQALHVYGGSVVRRHSVSRRNFVKCHGIHNNGIEDESCHFLNSVIPSGGLVKACAKPSLALKHIKAVGLEGTGGSTLASELIEEHKMSEVVGVASNDNRILTPNAVPNLVELQGKALRRNAGRNNRRKIWNRFMSSNRVVKENVPANSSEKRERFEFEQENAEMKAYLSAIGPQTTVEHCTSILKILSQKGDEKVLQLFEWMRSNGKLERNVIAHTIALQALARKNDWLAVEALLQEMTTLSCHLDCQVFNTLILLCSRKKNMDMGSKLFHMMLDEGVQPNIATFSVLMILYQKGGRLSEAEFAFNKMRSCKIRCATAYSAMITIYTRKGLYNEAESIISVMDEDEVQPDRENWLVRINAYSQQGKLEKAESILASMLEAGVSPNVVAYNTLITGYGKISDTDAVKRLFQSLKGLGLKPDETTYRSMIESYGRADNYKETMRYYMKLKSSGFCPTSANFYTIINLQTRHGDDHGVVQTLKDMRLLGCQHSSILTILLQAHERVGSVHKLPQILKSSFYENILADQTSSSMLVMAYVRASLLDDALAILRERKWRDFDFEDNLYHLLICSCKESDNYENADIIFKQMLEQRRDMNLHIISSMIDVYGCMGKFQEAEDLYLKLRASGLALDMVACSVVVRMYMKAGSLKGACLVLDMMEQQENIVPDIFLYRDMLRIYQRCRMLQKLSEVYYQILKSGLPWDEAMYNCVINCCARALPVDELSRLLDEMLQSGYTPNTVTFNVMLDVYGKAGFLQKARKLLSMARKQGLADVISYNTVIAAYGQTKDFGNMESIVRQMQTAGYPISLEAYNCLLDAYGKGDQLEEFNDVLKKMKQAKCDSDHYTYNILINIYGNKGWVEEVSNVLAELRARGLEPDLYSYNTLIKVYGIAGMVKEAVNVMKEMRSKGIQPDRVTYINLISALQRNEEFLEAVKWSLWMKQMGMST